MDFLRNSMDLELSSYSSPSFSSILNRNHSNVWYGTPPHSKGRWLAPHCNPCASPSAVGETLCAVVVHAPLSELSHTSALSSSCEVWPTARPMRSGVIRSKRMQAYMPTRRVESLVYPRMSVKWMRGQRSPIARVLHILSIIITDCDTFV